MGEEQLNADEVFEMAEVIEKRGLAFYQEAARVSDDAESRDLFGTLASMEGEHEQVFSAIRDHVAGRVGGAGKDALYWNSVAAAMMRDIELQLAERFVGRKSRQEILEAALGFEKDTVLFFLSVRNMVSGSADKRKIDAIIKEEIGHVLLLNSRLTHVRPPQGGLPVAETKRAAAGDRPS
jgi:rubrerythrin